MFTANKLPIKKKWNVYTKTFLFYLIMKVKIKRTKREWSDYFMM